MAPDGSLAPATPAFDYGDVPKPQQQQLRAAAETIRQGLRRTVEEMMTVGRALAEAKQLLPHGQFIAWIEAETGMSERAARGFIAVHQRFCETAMIADLAIPPTALERLARAPEDAVNEVVARAEAGEKIKVADVEAIVRRARGAGDKGARQTAEPMDAVLQPGAAGLRALSERGREEVLAETIARLQGLARVLGEADREAKETGRVVKARLYKATRHEALWLFHALECLSNRRAGEGGRPSAHQVAVLERPRHDRDGPWDALALALLQIADGTFWETTKAGELVERVPEWTRTVRAALGPDLEPDPA